MSEESELQGMQNFSSALFYKEDDMICRNMHFLLTLKSHFHFEWKKIPLNIFIFPELTHIHKNLLTIDIKKLKF